MKRLFALIMLIALLSAPIFVQAGYGLFVFAGTAAAEIKDKTISATNTMFGEVSNDYYQVYFFASPYYATGTGTTPSTDEDPLTIANSENNPYNVKDKFCILGGGNGNFNVTINNSRYRAMCKINGDGTTGNELNLEFYEKRDFTGYIRANEVEINGKKVTIKKTSTYVSFTVQGNIDADLLNAVVAQSEFEDTWGFGPEFIGWTADKQSTFDRTTYSGKRYLKNNSNYAYYLLNETEDGGYKIQENSTGAYEVAERVGYYGCQGTIEQVTSNTSLSALDESDKDGSKAGDKVIYLYPVFVAKNYDKTNAVETNIKNIPLIKFRINPGDNPSAYQSDEIDYSLDPQRYTVCLFQRKLETTSSGEYNVNYYTGDFYLDTSGTVQLDYNDFEADWKTILTSETIKEDLTTGYYNVDVTFVFDQYLQNTLKQQYDNSNKYVHTYAGTISSSGMSGSFVIGFQKVDDFRMVYQQEDFNFSYDSDDYEQVYTVTDDNENRYYYVDNVYLDENEDFTFLIEGSTGISIEAMAPNATYCTCGCTVETPCGETCETCGGNCKEYYSFKEQEYWLPGIVYSTEGRDANIYIPQTGKELACKVAGYYSFVFKVVYEDGRPQKIQVAYHKNEDQYRIVILNKEPGKNIFIGQTVDGTSAMYAPTWGESGIEIGSAFGVYTGTTVGIVAVYTADKHSTVSKDGSSFQIYEQGKDVQLKLLADFLNSDVMSGKELYDTATGLEVTGLFENGDFQLNRNYVLYIG